MRGWACRCQSVPTATRRSTSPHSRPTADVVGRWKVAGVLVRLLLEPQQEVPLFRFLVQVLVAAAVGSRELHFHCSVKGGVQEPRRLALPPETPAAVEFL